MNTFKWPRPTYIYYSHCMSDYGSETSKEHVKLLKNLGFEVIDPSAKEHSDKVEEMKANGKTSEFIMEYFLWQVRYSDHLAFRTMADGSLSAGVSSEIEVMKKKGGTVLQMPNFDNKVLTVEETREHLREYRDGKEKEKKL